MRFEQEGGGGGEGRKEGKKSWEGEEVWVGGGQERYCKEEEDVDWGVRRKMRIGV